MKHKQRRAKTFRNRAEPHALSIELEATVWARVQEAAGLAGQSPRVWAAAVLARQASVTINRQRTC